MAYIGSSPTKVVSRQSANIFTYTATANQTAFTGSDANGNTLACSPSDIMVHMNGLRLEESDYTASTTTVTLGSGAAAGDEVTITAFVTFESADHYNKSTADTRYVNTTGDTMTGSLTGTSAGFTGDVNIGNNASSNPLSKLRLGGTQYGAADIRPTDEGGHKVGMAFYTDGTGDTTIDPVLRMTIDSSGIVTKPNQPCFHAYPSTTTTVLNTTNATWEKLPFDTTAWDVGNNFNTTNKRFTAPVTGMYLMNWMFQIENANSVTWMYAYPLVNGSTNQNRSKGVVFADFRVFENYHTESGSWIMKLSANDYVEMHSIMSASGSTKNFKEESFWSGYLLG